MIVGNLKTKIEDYAARLERDNRLLRLARQGGVSAEIITAYLSGVLFMIRHTPVHLERAARRAEAVGRQDLGRFFLHKLTEERGHDQWALQDFKELSRLFGHAAAQQPHASMVHLVGVVERAIDQEPASYLSYILLVEYLTVLIGPTWLAALEERCGIPRHALSVVSKHVELDQEHVEEGLLSLERLVTEADAVGLTELLTRSIACYDAFYDALHDLHADPPAAHASL